MSTSADFPHWIDGARADTMPVSVRALQYGDGVFRTLLRHAGTCHVEDEQIQHLVADAAALGMPLRAADLVQALRTVEADGLPAQCIVRLTVLRGGRGRGYAPPVTGEPHLLIASAPLPDWPTRCWQPGIRAGWLRHRLGLQSTPLAGVKHLNRLDQVLAAQEVETRDLDEGICTDLRGLVASGSRSNLFWVRQQRLFTPRLEACGVQGLTRMRIMRAAARLGMDLSEVDATPEVVEAADEIFFCNSLMGVWPVYSLDGRRLPEARIAPAVHAALDHPLPPGTA